MRTFPGEYEFAQPPEPRSAVVTNQSKPKTPLDQTFMAHFDDVRATPIRFLPTLYNFFGDEKSHSLSLLRVAISDSDSTAQDGDNRGFRA
jgi:hypothetical protein